MQLRSFRKNWGKTAIDGRRNVLDVPHCIKSRQGRRHAPSI